MSTLDISFSKVFVSPLDSRLSRYKYPDSQLKVYSVYQVVNCRAPSLFCALPQNGSLDPPPPKLVSIPTCILIFKRNTHS